jgi:MFS family permease
MFFLGSLYLERVLGYDALEIGLAFLPVTITMGTMSVRYSERLTMRFGARTTLIPGLVLIFAGLALFTRAPVGGNYFEHVFPVTVLLGIGAGMSFPALMQLAMSGATPEDAGLASGLVNTTAQVGAALGLAILATLSASHTEALAGDGHSAAAALTGGYHFAFWIAAALVLVTILVALVVLKQPAKQEAQVQEMPVADDVACCEAA